ncbi:MAG: hypothetical protein R2788_00720 [Saprospiraceae bacterium]
MKIVDGWKSASLAPARQVIRIGLLFQFIPFCIRVAPTNTKVFGADGINTIKGNYAFLFLKLLGSQNGLAGGATVVVSIANHIF